MSALSDALNRLVTGYYNSNPINALTNPGGLGNDGHETNFPAALVDYALVVQYLAAINGNDLVALSAALASKAGNNVFTGSNDFTASALTVLTQALEDSSTKAASTALLHKFFPRGYIDGLTLSAPGGGTSMTIAGGSCADSANAVIIPQAASMTKTTAAWAVGAGNGGLDQGTVANGTWYHFYKIRRPDTGVDDILYSQAPDTAGAATMTLASPCVVTKAVHGLQVGAPCAPTTTGALPTGLTAGVTYYVKTVPDVNTFTLSATQGGAAINTSGTQSGVHTITSAPAMPANYSQRRYIGSWLLDAAGKWVGGFQNGDRVTWNAPINCALGTALSTTPAILYTQPGAPPGRPVRVFGTAGGADTAASANGVVVYSPLGSTQAADTPGGNWTFRMPASASYGGPFEEVADQAGRLYAVSSANANIWINIKGFYSPRGKDF